MCGIIGLIGRPSTRPAPTSDELVAGLERALVARPDTATMARHVAGVDAALLGVPGVLALAGRPDVVAALTARLDQLDATARDVEAELDANAAGLDAAALERANADLISLKDALWAVRHDRFRSAASVDQLAGRDAAPSVLAGYLLVHQALSAIDRLEVRGRDSAGLHLYVWGHDLDAAGLEVLIAERNVDPLFPSGSVVAADGGVLSFVYKAAAEIGELGDNTAVLRAAISADRLLRRALESPEARVAVLGHTRWASVGIISEPNTHPLNSVESEPSDDDPPYVVAALNGDVDNHADLRVQHGLRIAAPITTDAKVIPTLVARRRASAPLVEAFRRTVVEFDGSVAIGAAAAEAPSTLLLALRGSGQGLYVGLADDCFIVASEPYGVVEETARYVRMDGENGGEVVVLDGAAAGELGGITRLGYDGSPIPVDDSDVIVAEVTTRDINRGDAPHFLLKEISEAPVSFAKTLRGKIAERDGVLHAPLGDTTLPPATSAALAAGTIRRVRVIGQGTAAVAGQSTADILDELTGGALDVAAVTATELSGFGMRLDMSDTLAVAVSQSGTTTDTNRTVDLLRSRGAHVIGIVNRRSSDLTDKSDGVLYTSDGRDVEMSVASTKAFYSQIAAGALLAVAVADIVAGSSAGADPAGRQRLLESLRELPTAMEKVITMRGAIGRAAAEFAPSRRYWAIVGNGPNVVAAREIRIKLSELCYKSIAADSTEDKKHIDLSSEPMILVCAAGLTGSTADDVAKEVAIYRAHQAAPIVIATDGGSRWSSALDVISVPDTHPRLGFVLSAMAGHLFGYEAALAIDALAHPLREARAAIESAARVDTDAAHVAAALVPTLTPLATRYFDDLRTRDYDGTLDASTAVRLATLLRYATGVVPLDAYVVEMGRVGTPGVVIEDLTEALTRAIEELTRPVDAIKHQAKTVTVGISRSDETLLEVPLVRATLDAGAARDHLSYRVLRTLADLDPAVSDVVGHTRYAVAGPLLDGHDGDEGATITVVDKGGIARDIPSRAER